MAWTKLTDMKRPDDAFLDCPMPASVTGPRERYPYGLRIHLDEKDLEKLKIDTLPNVGDVIDVRALARVTCVECRENDDGGSKRIELQIEQIATENENEEVVERGPRRSPLHDRTEAK